MKHLELLTILSETNMFFLNTSIIYIHLHLLGEKYIENVIQELKCIYVHLQTMAKYCSTGSPKTCEN